MPKEIKTAERHVYPPIDGQRNPDDGPWESFHLADFAGSQETKPRQEITPSEALA